MNWEKFFAARTEQMRRSAIRELLKVTAQPEVISFAGGLPAPEFFPMQEIGQACDHILTGYGQRALQYGETEGISELRDWVAERASRPGEAIRRTNVMIVSGAQQGLDLIGRILLDPGDEVIVENPTYLALLSAWRPLGVKFLAAPTDENGMRVEEIRPALWTLPKLVYCTPNFQNPQGTTLPPERREQLVSLARESRVGLVEDDPYGELRFRGAPPPSLLSISLRDGNVNQSPVVQVGTFSKVIAPGLRVGWIIGAETVIEKLARAKQALDLHTSTFNQLIIYELMRESFLDHHLPKLREAYRNRRDAMFASLESHWKNEATWTRPEGGMFLMVRLGQQVQASDLLRHALKRHVAFVPGEEFHLHGRGTNTFRLNFSNAKPDMIHEGVRRLAAALSDLPRPRND